MGFLTYLKTEKIEEAINTHLENIYNSLEEINARLEKIEKKLR